MCVLACFYVCFLLFFHVACYESYEKSQFEKKIHTQKKHLEYEKTKQTKKKKIFWKIDQMGFGALMDEMISSEFVKFQFLKTSNKQSIASYMLQFPGFVTQFLLIDSLFIFK